MSGREGEERRCVWQLSTLYSSEKPAAACALRFVAAAAAAATLGTVPCMQKQINSRNAMPCCCATRWERRPWREASGTRCTRKFDWRSYRVPRLDINLDASDTLASFDWVALLIRRSVVRLVMPHRATRSAKGDDMNSTESGNSDVKYIHA
jgi:hypothetical protein